MEIIRVRAGRSVEYAMNSEWSYAQSGHKNKRTKQRSGTALEGLQGLACLHLHQANLSRGCLASCRQLMHMFAISRQHYGVLAPYTILYPFDVFVEFFVDTVRPLSPFRRTSKVSSQSVSLQPSALPMTPWCPIPLATSRTACNDSGKRPRPS
jgi:hypothetical protein